jgi:hypothetical protein
MRQAKKRRRSGEAKEKKREGAFAVLPLRREIEDRSGIFRLSRGSAMADTCRRQP